MGRRTVIGMTFPSFILFCIRATFVYCLTGLDSGLCWASFRPDHAFLSVLGYPLCRPLGQKKTPPNLSRRGGFFLYQLQEKAYSQGRLGGALFSFHTLCSSMPKASATPGKVT